jgi:hypothetical protein
MPTVVKIKRRKKQQPKKRTKVRVAFSELWDNPIDVIKLRLEGRRVTFVWRSILADMIREETFVVYKVKGFDPETGLLQFWDKQGRGLRTFRVEDVADIRG